MLRQRVSFIIAKARALPMALRLQIFACVVGMAFMALLYIDICRLEDGISDLDGQVSDLRMAIYALSSDSDDLESKIDDVESDVSNLESDIRRLKYSVSY